MTWPAGMLRALAAAWFVELSGFQRWLEGRP
jgi:hypothetical protein